MVGLLAALALRADEIIALPEPNSAAMLAEIRPATGRLNTPKKCPRSIAGRPAYFDYETDGFIRDDAKSAFRLTFRVFTQLGAGPANQVTRLLLRINQLLRRRWRMDNPYAYNNGYIDVYLSENGQPGGEQFFGIDYPTRGPGTNVNVICIYDLSSFTNPLEMAREVAHEYGHAVLPAIGGFKQPEDWANGYLGEKLFLRWIRDEISSRKLESEDAMGLGTTGLDSWLTAQVNPLVGAAATNGPNVPLLKQKGPAAMAAYHGLVLYMDAILPKSAAARTMMLIGSTNAWDYPHSCVMAVQELDRFTLNVPQILKGKPIWIPLGKGIISGTRILQRKGEWAQIAPATEPIVVTPANPD